MSTSIHSGASAWAIATRSPGTFSVDDGEDAGELLERLLAAAHLADRVDDAVVDGQDRLDVEQRAGERLGAADATALLEVLERGDREDDAVLLLEPLDQRLDLLVGRAPREPALDREREQPDRERRGLGVDDADPVASDLARPR